MIGLPSHLEQHINFEIALKRGFGIKMTPRRVSGDKLVNALERILNEPHFRENAAKYSDAVRTTRGAETAADIVERTAYEGKPAGWQFQ